MLVREGRAFRCPALYSLAAERAARKDDFFVERTLIQYDPAAATWGRFWDAVLWRVAWRRR